MCVHERAGIEQNQTKDAKHIVMSTCVRAISTTYNTCTYYTMEHSYNKPEIPGQPVRYKQEFVISEQFPMRYCSTWLRSLLCYIKTFVI